MKKIHIQSFGIFICLFFTFSLSGQLTINATTTPSTCSSNGSISATATGGSGDYTFELTSPCLSNPIFNSTGIFISLATCQYTVVVTDGAGNSESETTIVTGSYTAPTLQLLCSGCSIEVIVSNGKSPFNYSFSSIGLSGPYSTPTGSNIFNNLTPGVDYWIKVEDDCGNIVTEQCITGDNSALDISRDFQNDTLIIYAFGGTTGNYNYTLTSSAGTFNNTTGVFPADKWGCNIEITVSDGCDSSTRRYSNNPQLSDICTNFADGTATMTVEAAEPYEVIAYTPDGNFYSDDGNFSGLPINVSEYRFRVKDACDDYSMYYEFFPIIPVFSQLPVSCSDNSLTLIAKRVKCKGGVDFKNLPATVECLSCPSLSSGVLGGSRDSVVLEGSVPGQWEFSWEDDCGDHFICNDTIILKIRPYCDSLRAIITNQFYCDNGQNSARPLLADGETFYLKNSIGEKIDSSLTGLFTDVLAGEYSVEIEHPDCGFLEENTEIGIQRPLTVDISPEMGVSNFDGACKISYSLEIDADQGDLMLTGNGESYLLNNDGIDSDCEEYPLYDLPPGNYELTALGFCGSTTFVLPEYEPGFDLQATGDGACPGAGNITVTGAIVREEWDEWLDSLNLSLPIYAGGLSYYSYGDNGREGGSRIQRDSSYIIRNVPSGTHSVYLYVLSGNCPIDTVSVYIPEAVLPEFNFSAGVLCDGASSVDLTASFSGGEPPFTLQEMDCNNLSVVKEDFGVITDSIFLFNGTTQGEYCFRLVDGCQTSLDKQLSVGYFEDDIEIDFLCDNTIELKVDNFPSIDYQWTDESGNPIGNVSNISVQNPGQETTFKVRIDLGNCMIEREILVPETEIIPTVNITGDSVLCGSGALTLNAVSNSSNLLWSSGSTDENITVNASGNYSVTATSSFGCTDISDIQVQQIPEIIPEFEGDLSICRGDSGWLQINNQFESIQWSSGNTSDSVQVFPTDIVNVSITDEFGCNWQNDIEIILNELPIPVISGDSLVCENESTSLQLDQGYADYFWSTGSNQSSISANAGIFRVTVTDDNACENDTTFTVTEIPAIEIELTGDTLLCKDSMAVVRVILKNATQPISLTWNDAIFNNIPPITNDTLIQVSATENLTLFIESAFSNNYDCPFKLSDPINILTNQPVAEINILANYNSFEISCKGARDGAIEVAPKAGIAPFSYQWSTGATTADLNDLPEGEYSVVVTDSLGCRTDELITLTPPDPIRPTWEIHPPLCFDINDGIIQFDIWTGGAGSLTIFENGVAIGSPPLNMDNLPPGDYNLEIEDENSCTIDTALFFPQPIQFELDLGNDLYVGLGDEIQLESISNLPIDSFSWSPQIYLLDASLAPFTRPLSGVEYNLQVWTKDKCTASDQLEIRVDKSPVIFVPSAFSPNGDGINDVFTVFAKENNVTNIRSLMILDRWGELVYSRKDFLPNGTSVGWDGYFRNKPAPIGVFLYSVEFEMSDGRIETEAGDVTLMR